MPAVTALRAAAAAPSSWVYTLLHTLGGASRQRGRREGRGGCDIEKEMFDAAARRLDPALPQLSPKHLARTVHVFAKVHHAAPELYSHAARVVVRRLQESSAPPRARTDALFAAFAQMQAGGAPAPKAAAATSAEAFNAQDVSTLLWAYARVRGETHGLFDCLGDWVTTHAADFTPQWLAMAARAYATVPGAAHTPPYDPIAQAALARLPQCALQDLAQLALSYGEARCQTPLAQRLMASIAHALPKYLGQGPVPLWQLGQVVTGFTKACDDACQASRGDLAAVLTAVDAHVCGRGGVGDGEVDDLCALVAGCAVAGGGTPQLYDAVERAVLQRMHRGRGRGVSPQALAHTARAFSRAQHVSFRFFAAAAEAVPAGVCDLSMLHLSDVAWAYAAVEMASGAVFEAVAAEATQRFSAGRAHEATAASLAHLLWACARALHHAPALFSAAAAQAQRVLENGTMRDTSLILWAYSAADAASRDDAAAAGACATGVLDSAEAAVLRKVADLASSDIPELTTILWAYAAASLCKPALFEAAGRAIAARCGACTPRDLTTVVWACAAAQHRGSDAALHTVTTWVAQHGLAGYNAQDLANLVWGCARLARADPHVFNAAEAAIIGRLHDFNGLSLAKALWAFQRVAHKAPALHEAAAGTALEKAAASPDAARALWVHTAAAGPSTRGDGHIHVEHSVESAGKVKQALPRVRRRAGFRPEG